VKASVLRVDCGERYVNVLHVCWVGYRLVVLQRGLSFA
jgi:hypothetical protein